jgi:hypothetical protein
MRGNVGRSAGRSYKDLIDPHFRSYRPLSYEMFALSYDIIRWHSIYRNHAADVDPSLVAPSQTLWQSIGDAGSGDDGGGFVPRCVAS